jgi:hypothetical protein
VHCAVPVGSCGAMCRCRRSTCTSGVRGRQASLNVCVTPPLLLNTAAQTRQDSQKRARTDRTRCFSRGLPHPREICAREKRHVPAHPAGFVEPWQGFLAGMGPCCCRGAPTCACAAAKYCACAAVKYCACAVVKYCACAAAKYCACAAAKYCACAAVKYCACAVVKYCACAAVKYCACAAAKYCACAAAKYCACAVVKYCACAAAEYCACAVVQYCACAAAKYCAWRVQAEQGTLVGRRRRLLGEEGRGFWKSEPPACTLHLYCVLVVAPRTSSLYFPPVRRACTKRVCFA